VHHLHIWWLYLCFSLEVRIRLLLINIFHISHNFLNAVCPKLYWLFDISTNLYLDTYH
jgi:hypothetical protein